MFRGAPPFAASGAPAPGGAAASNDNATATAAGTAATSDAERAYAEVSASLQGLTSPNLGITFNYEEPLEPPTAWLERQDREDEEEDAFLRGDDDDVDDDDYDYDSDEDGDDVGSPTRMMMTTMGGGVVDYDDDEYDDRAKLPPSGKKNLFPGHSRPAGASLQRADTPIMSNAASARKKNQRRQQAETPTAGGPPAPVDTPQQQQQQQAIIRRQSPPVGPSSPTTASGSGGTIGLFGGGRGNKGFPTSSSSASHAEYRRYHDALLQYTNSKRNLLLQQSQSRSQQLPPAGEDTMEIEGGASSSGRYGGGEQLAVDDDRTTQIELGFLRSLHRAGWDRASASAGTGAAALQKDPACKEGNFWLLLFDLRKLGDTALLWGDDERSKGEHRAALLAYLQDLAERVRAPPRELIAATHPEGKDGVGGSSSSPAAATAPLTLVRRRTVQRWLHACFQHLVPSGATRPRPIEPPTAWLNELMRPSSSSSSGGIGGGAELVSTGAAADSNEKEDSVLRDCLALLMAGHWDDRALQLLRDCNLPGRAAAWGGGTPHGYHWEGGDDDDNEQSTTSTGNSNRPLWKRLLWLQSQSLAQNGATADTPMAAIVALLSNHLPNALSHRSLRSWESGLAATVHCSLGRMEDELLHMHNNNRRRTDVPFPGTQYRTKEIQHLQATSDVAGLDEDGMVHHLAASPFEEMQASRECFVTQATAGVLVGRNALLSYLDTSVQRLLENQQGTDADLRFLVHLLLYLDSLGPSAGSQQWGPEEATEELAEWKNRTLLEYVFYLASREDLWYSIVLYASHLPEPEILEYLPPLLKDITSNDERKVIVQQLRDFLPCPGLDLRVLRRLVRGILLSEPAGADARMLSLPPPQGDDADYDDGDNYRNNTPTKWDTRKMSAILWLCFDPEHVGDALVMANVLFRQFLLADKLASAFLFLDDVLPDRVVSTVLESSSTPSGDNDDEENNNNSNENARSEHEAYHSYLGSIRAVENWRNVLAGTDPVTSLVDDALDTANLNATEADIATKMERRQLVDEKRKQSWVVVAAAERAQKALKAVLESPGGWLLTEDEVATMEEDDDGSGEDERSRRNELSALRSKLLPKVVMLYSDVCLETAAWMNASLNDAAERTDCSWQSALANLDETGASKEKLGTLPLFPGFWTRRGLDLAQLVASDTYSIKSACGEHDLSELLAKLSEATVADLLYTCTRRSD